MMNLEAVTDEEVKLSAAQQRNLFVELCYSGLDAATASLHVAAVFYDLGYIDPKKAEFRIPYQCVPLEIQMLPQDVAPAKPKPKPKPAAWRLFMNVFVARNWLHVRLSITFPTVLCLVICGTLRPARCMRDIISAAQNIIMHV